MRKLVLRIAALATLVAAVAIPAATSSNSLSTFYTVAFNTPNGLPANVDRLVADAGGTITTRIPEVGGIGVYSTNPNFASAMAAASSVKAVDASLKMSIPEANAGPIAMDADNNAGTYSPTGPDCAPPCMPDSLGSEQWDKKKMDVPASYALQRGRPDVRVFVIDTGLDLTHPDRPANYDAADSVSFVPTEPTVQDFNGHGTWTATAIGAPINGIGISGVAPNVSIAIGKVLDAEGSGEFLWTIEAMVYAGIKHFDVVSASLGGYIPKCGNQKVDASGNPICDHAEYILLNRATQFARSNGVLPVAALGNDGFDLSDGQFFRNFVEAPGEIPGWVGVSATGYLDNKAFYSNYGTGKTDVSAPGGSTRDYNGVSGQPGFCPHGGLCRLIGAWSTTGSESPSDPEEVCTGPAGAPPCGLYGYVQGTSMATPNAAGVAALIISQYGDFNANNPNKPHMSPTQVEQILQGSANNQPCPTPKTVTQGGGFVFATATCQGDTGYNSFFGKGIVDAFKAVTYKK